jgi:hypothetical protein
LGFHQHMEHRYRDQRWLSFSEEYRAVSKLELIMLAAGH